MAEPFLSEIRLMSFVFAPKGWALCNGQFLPINQNQALFALLGTTYGGNGQTTFALPDLRGRTPIHMGNWHTLGERGGSQTSTLTLGQMPAHAHALYASNNNATTDTPGINVVMAQASTDMYRNLTNPVPLNSGSDANTGGSQPHENMQPYLTLSFCIALQGIFPSQT